MSTTNNIIKTNQIISGRKISNENNFIDINNTLRIYKTSKISGSNHETSNISLRANNTSDDNDFANIYTKKDGSRYDLYIHDNNNRVITRENVETDLANTEVSVKNLSVGVNGDDTSGYINFFNTGNTSIGENGIGLRLATGNGIVQMKNATGQITQWTNLTGVETTLMTDLLDVTIDQVSLSNNHILIYDSSQGEWVNKGNIVLPGTLDLGGNLSTSNNFVKFYDNYGLTDSVGNELLVFNGNTTTKGNVNYFKLHNSDVGSDPKIEVIGSDADINLDINSKGAGDIELTSDSGNVVISSTNLNIGGYIKSSIFKTSSNSSYAPTQYWNIPISSDTLLFDFIEADTLGTYYANVSAGIEGQKLNVIFNNSGSKNINVLMDFESNNLISGSGYAQILKFNTLGQSASLIYLGNPINKWQILNSGCIVL